MNADSDFFRWQPYGGLGEVGMNCMLFRFGDVAIPVDAGILFADPNDYGVEALSVDYEPIIETYRPKIWLFTHAHEDHIGAVTAILAASKKLGIPAPRLVAPRFAAALMREKIAEDQRYPGYRADLDKIEVVQCDSAFDHEGVRIHFIKTRHSTPDTCSLGFEWTTPTGRSLRVIHTADFKIDEGRFEDGVVEVSSYGAVGPSPDFLFVDSTNSERNGHSVSELALEAGLEKVIRQAEGRVFVTLFASNVYRIANILKVAGACGRYVAISGRSLQNAHRLGTSLGIYDDCPDFDATRLLEASDLVGHPPEKQLVICSGSQGELRSVLTKVSNDQHPEYSIGPGDTVLFSSKLIPGNERSVGRLINSLMRQGARVLWEEKAKEVAGGPVHASGHARAGEIRDLLRFLRPKCVVPVHGELRQLLANAQLAREEGRAWSLPEENIHIVENGVQLVFVPDSNYGWKLLRRENPYERPSRLLRFDRFACRSSDPFLRVRKRAAQGGCLAVSLDSGGRFRISLDGHWPDEDVPHIDREYIMGEIERWVFGRFKLLQREGRSSFPDPRIENDAADELGRFVRKLTGTRPYVIFHWMEQG